jgi:alpha-L-arabinofuranosidase
VPYLRLAAVHDEAGGALTVFALNRHLEEELLLDLRAKGFDGLELDQALELRDDDLQATNTKAAPERVKPAPLGTVAVEGERLRDARAGLLERHPAGSAV